MFFENELGLHIEDHLHLAYYLYALHLKNQNPKNARYILLLPKFWWAKDVRRHLKHLPVEVMIMGRHCEWFLLKAYSKRLKLRFGTLKEKPVEANKQEIPFLRPTVRAFTQNFSRNGNRSEETKICAVLCDGAFPGERNNIRWLWNEYGHPHTLVLYVWEHLKRILSRKEVDYLKSIGSLLWRRKKYDARSQAEVPVWNDTINTFRFMWRMIAPLLPILPTVFSPKASRLRWQLYRYLYIVPQAAKVSDFFNANNIKIFIEELHSRPVFINALAVANVNGISIISERSQEYDNHHIISSRPADIIFISGAHSLRQLVLKENRCPTIVATGFVPDETHHATLNEQMAFIRSKLPNDKPVVTIIDEPGLIYGTESVALFYQTLFEDIAKTKSYHILIKPKKALTLSNLPNATQKRLAFLIERGYVTILTPDCSVTLAAKIADLSISLPSTGMFNAIYTGSRTVVFNPYRTIRRIFYEQELYNRCIYEDINRLVRDMHAFFNGRMSNFGDCESVYRALDPFGDNGAAVRIGRFLNDLRDALEKTGSVHGAIDMASVIYCRHWGEERIGKRHELWNGLKHRTPELILSTNL
jgi:hypothetical protein